MPDDAFAAACPRVMSWFRSWVMNRRRALLPAALVCCAAAAHAAPGNTLAGNAAAVDGQAGAQPQEAPFSRQPERPPPPPPPVNYVCDDGTKIVARFPDSVLAMLTIGDDRYELRAAIAASGVRYVGGSVTFWTHQGTARFTRGGATTECRETPASSGK